MLKQSKNTLLHKWFDKPIDTYFYSPYYLSTKKYANMPNKYYNYKKNPLHDRYNISNNNTYPEFDDAYLFYYVDTLICELIDITHTCDYPIMPEMRDDIYHALYDAEHTINPCKPADNLEYIQER